MRRGGLWGVGRRRGQASEVMVDLVSNLDGLRCVKLYTVGIMEHDSASRKRSRLHTSQIVAIIREDD